MDGQFCLVTAYRKMPGEILTGAISNWLHPLGGSLSWDWRYLAIFLGSNRLVSSHIPCHPYGIKVFPVEGVWKGIQSNTPSN
jgi:hypothetical protein